MEEIFRGIVCSVKNSENSSQSSANVAFSAPSLGVGEAERSGGVRWGLQCDLFSGTKGDMQTVSLLEGEHQWLVFS